MKNRRRVSIFVILCIFCLLGTEAFAEDNAEVQERVEKAKGLGYQDWIDEEGYLVDEFYDGKSDEILSELGVDGLVKTLSEEELEAYVNQLNMGISLYTVTRYKKVSQVNPITGGTLYTGIFEVDGVLAFCIERSVATPPKYSPTSTPVEVTNEKLRKVLYYGYNGPGDLGYTYVETALAAGEANGDGDNSLGRAILAEIVLLESPPKSFKVWKVETNDGSTQDLAYYTTEEAQSMQATIIKYRAGTTKSLQGAVFGHIGPDGIMEQIVTDDEGKIVLELQPGYHEIKEIEAPEGYLLNENIICFEVDDKNNIVVTSTVDESFGNVITQMDDNGNFVVEVEDKIGYLLPQTGGVPWCEVLGTSICFMAILVRKDGILCGKR